MRTQLRAFVRAILVAVAAVASALALGAILILMEGQSPFEVYRVLFEEALGRASGLSQVAFKTTTLIFTGLAAACAFRAGLFNLGAEGQLYLGAFASALAVLALPPGAPPPVAISVGILAALFGGAAAAALPAVLKAFRGTHEVINTMMMNFIVSALVNVGLGFVRESPEVVRTHAVPESARLALFLRGFDGNTALFFAIGLALLGHHVFARTLLGYELRVVGANPRAAEFGGISVRRITLIAVLGSGAIAGLGGINFVLGSPGYFEQHFAPGQGFLGVAVALLARNQPLAVVPAAMLFAVMAEGSQSIQAFVPKELGSILQAFVVVAVVVWSRVADLLEKRRPAS